MRWRCALPTRRFPLSQPLFLCSVDTTIHILMNYRTLQNFSKILKGLGKMGKCNFKSGQKPRFIIKKRLWIPGNYGHSYGSLFSIVNPHHFSDSPISCSPCFFYVSDFFFFSIFLCVRSFFADALSFIWNILQWFRLQSRAKWRRRYIWKIYEIPEKSSEVHGLKFWKNCRPWTFLNAEIDKLNIFDWEFERKVWVDHFWRMSRILKMSRMLSDWENVKN